MAISNVSLVQFAFGMRARIQRAGVRQAGTRHEANQRLGELGPSPTVCTPLTASRWRKPRGAVLALGDESKCPREQLDISVKADFTVGVEEETFFWTPEHWTAYDELNGYRRACGERLRSENFG